MCSIIYCMCIVQAYNITYIINTSVLYTIYYYYNIFFSQLRTKRPPFHKHGRIISNNNINQ